MGNSQNTTYPQISETNAQICETIFSYKNLELLYGAMQLSDIKEMKRLKEENAKLKKLVADLSLEKLVLKEVAEGNF